MCAANVTLAEGTNKPALIPWPQSVELRAGQFMLRPGTVLVADAAAQTTAHYLAAQLKRFAGCDLSVRPQSPGARAAQAKGNLWLTTQGPLVVTGPEAYELTVGPEGVVLRASTSAGLFYGVQTLLQLLPPPPAAGVAPAATNRVLRAVHIVDQPRFKWRGLHLDVARHFFSKAEVEQLLDAMARYKLNTFHWHLTDDQGWRIEIKQYPLLTQKGAWRQSIGFGLDPKAGTAYGPDGRYGGFYTQQEIREVVAYAAARHITIVPEIEMPGHASAALMAYPQFSCTGGPFTTDLPGGVFNGIYCTGNEDTFMFLEGVLSEVISLFPGKYLHVGGDEVPTNNWKQCAKCQARMRQEGLKEEKELESYLIRRMEKFLNAHQRTLVGWSEIREGGLAENAVVMDWVGGAVEAATAGHDVVMSPQADCYFDKYQSEDHSTEPKAIGGFLPLSQVYAFEPLPAQLRPQDAPHILGAQANVWTEYIGSLAHVEYMVFPRVCALSEVVWSPKAARDWPGFQQRLQPHYVTLENLGLNYRHPDAQVRAARGAAKP